MRALAGLVFAGCGRVAFDPGGVSAGDSAVGDGVLGDTGAADTAVAITVDYPDFQPCPSEIVLVGLAACSGVITLTPEVASVVGAAWIATTYPIGPTTSFAIEVVFAFPSGGVGGDGAAIVAQNDSRGTGALGLVGGGLGYENIAPSLALELDTFMNPGDPASHHLGIDFDGTIDTMLASPAGFAMTSGAPFKVWFDYDGTQDLARGYVAQGTAPVKPASAVITASDDLTRLGSTMRFGLTAATGGGAQTDHRVLSWRVTITP